MKPIVSRKIRNAARGEDCTFQILGQCSFDPATTVLCHLPDGNKGVAMKSCDLTSAAFGCHSCHRAVDRQEWCQELEDRREWYFRRAQARTLARLVELGIIRVS